MTLTNVLGARAAPATQTIFLTMVRKSIAHHGQSPGTAVRSRTVGMVPVGVALAWTRSAIGQGVNRLPSAMDQLAAFQQFQIAWPSRSHRTVPKTPR